MTRKSSHSSTGKLKLLQNRLRGSINPLTTLSEIRPELSIIDLVALAEWLPKVRHKGQPVFTDEFPKRLAHINRSLALSLSVVSPVGEIAWAGVVLRRHAARIGVFVREVRIFEANLMAGNYEGGAQVLDLSLIHI